MTMRPLTGRNDSENERGQVLLFALLMLAAIFSLGMALSLIFLKEIRLSREHLESVRALYAADSGVEWELYRCFRDRNAPAPVMTNSASFTSLRAPGATTIVRAVGQSRGIYRGLEVPTTAGCL